MRPNDPVLVALASQWRLAVHSGLNPVVRMLPGITAVRSEDDYAEPDMLATLRHIGPERDGMVDVTVDYTPHEAANAQFERSDFVGPKGQDHGLVSAKQAGCYRGEDTFSLSVRKGVSLRAALDSAFEVVEDGASPLYRQWLAEGAPPSYVRWLEARVASAVHEPT